MLQDATDKQMDMTIRLMALPNDTVGTQMAQAYSTSHIDLISDHLTSGFAHPTGTGTFVIAASDDFIVLWALWVSWTLCCNPEEGDSFDVRTTIIPYGLVESISHNNESCAAPATQHELLAKL
ncbi:hypothetical protein M514_26741 [Trichuris suis]|uniref:Uncharacterized protein n=1 Tax=Trichuris suis TaxID=68888 RepID=A0A085MV53_9BILA|nr:hypothetical protein M514_26741 [Trichuris suis]